MLSPRVQREVDAAIAKYPGGVAVAEADGSTVLVIPNYPAGSGFNRSHVDIAIKVGVMFPAEKLDLLWVEDDLRRVDGSMPGNVMVNGVQLAGRTWMQISWHDQSPHDARRASILGYLRGLRAWFESQKIAS
jgi:hypothetical protein